MMSVLVGQCLITLMNFLKLVFLKPSVHLQQKSWVGAGIVDSCVSYSVGPSCTAFQLPASAPGKAMENGRVVGPVLAQVKEEGEASFS